jgi:RHS (Retrotransposon Hot Spot) family protein
LFVKEGVFQQDVESVSADGFAPFLWAFVDADARPDGVPKKLFDLHTNLYIMFTTSPKRERWKALMMCTICAEIIMNTWSLEEMRMAWAYKFSTTCLYWLVPHSAKIRGLTQDQQNLAEANFKKFGPTPRTCITFVKHEDLLRAHERRCQAAIADITYDSLRRFVRRGGTLDLDAESHAVLFVKRNKVEDLSEAYLEPISANIEMQLMDTIDNLQRLQRIDLYHAFASLDATKTVAGLVYESLGHTLLREGITLTLKPMVQSFQRKLFHWNSRSREQASNSMDLDDSEPVSFPPNIPFIYEGGLTSVEPNRLYVPKSRNQFAFDSFFKLDARLYIFQLTVAKSHDVKKGIKDSLSGILNILPPKANWRFVFITPPDCEVDVNANSEVERFLEGVTLYSAHLKIERQRI